LELSASGGVESWFAWSVASVVVSGFEPSGSATHSQSTFFVVSARHFADASVPAGQGMAMVSASAAIFSSAQTGWENGRTESVLARTSTEQSVRIAYSKLEIQTIQSHLTPYLSVRKPMCQAGNWMRTKIVAQDCRALAGKIPMNANEDIQDPGYPVRTRRRGKSRSGKSWWQPSGAEP
jgi:hypothetical protein